MTLSLLRTVPEGYWPLSSMLRVLERNYDQVEMIDVPDNDRDFQYYRVAIKGLQFLVLMGHAPDNHEQVLEFAFVGYFSGFGMTKSGEEALNRNLHISVAEVDEEQNLTLLTVLEARGSFNEDRFTQILDAWYRDIVMTLKMMSRDANFAETLSTQALTLLHDKLVNQGPKSSITERLNYHPVQDFQAETGAGLGAQKEGQKEAVNMTKAKPLDNHDVTALKLKQRSGDTELLQRFLGVNDAGRTLCDICDGRGRTGIFARSCRGCNGSGLTQTRS